MKKSQVFPAMSAFLLMLTMSLLSTALSFFVAPVCDDLGFGRGSFTLYYSLMVAAGAVSASPLGNFMNKHGVRPVIFASAVWCCVGFFALSVSSSLWMFYLTGAAVGLLGSTCVYLAANVIVQQSYSSHSASAVLGVVMAGAGIGGVLCSSLVPGLIADYGWRMTYRGLGVCWLILSVAAMLILGKQEATVAFGHARTDSDGASKKEALRSSRFLLVVTVMCVVTVASCVSQQLPSLLGELGYSGDEIGLMVSVMTAAAAVGTIAEGMVCSKLGIKYTMAAVLVMYAAGYVLLALGVGAVPALVCLAFGAGSIGTLMPIVVRRLFGGRDYAAIWSIVITCSSVASFLATPLWGMVYDFFHTYFPALAAMPVLLGVALVALLAAFRSGEQ